MKATLLETALQVAAATPGLYAVRSGSGAYFPMMAMLEAGHAVFRRAACGRGVSRRAAEPAVLPGGADRLGAAVVAHPAAAARGAAA